MNVQLPQLPPFLDFLRLPPVRAGLIFGSLLLVSLYALSSSSLSFSNGSSNNSPGSSTWYGGNLYKASSPFVSRPPAGGGVGAHLYDGMSGNLTAPTLVNATFVILARNTDVWEILASIRGMEDRFNKHYHYPYTFLNDEPFSDEFKLHTSFIASGPCSYGQIDPSQWSKHPDWIDEDKATKAREDMEAAHVIYGGSLSSASSGDIHSWILTAITGGLICDIPYDPFKVMEDGKKKYGFTVSLYEYAETIATLWDETKKFIKANDKYLAKPNLMEWLSNDHGDTYNRCHFWSNFEIGDLDFWRGEAYTKYFEHLDRAGGFFYERWGDAPVHSIAAGLFLKPEELHFFQDIGCKLFA